MDYTLPKYPLVECGRHPGAREPGYVICPHATPANFTFEMATPQNCGEILCQDCAAHCFTPRVIDALKLICIGCVKDLGFHLVKQ